MKRAEQIQTIVEDIGRLHRAMKPSTFGKYFVSRAEIGMLFMLYYHPGCSMKELADQIQVTKSAITQIMEPLIARDLVKRTPLASDRRVAHISLSDKGKKLISKFNLERTEKLRAAIDVLSDAELHQFHKLNLKISRALVKE